MKVKYLTAVAACLFSVTSVQAQGGADAYPDRQVRIVVPFSPGGGIDVLARTTGQQLAELWKVPVVVENRPGASGNIGNQAVVQAAPDGYTLLMTVNTITMTPSLYPSTPFDPRKDLTPIGETALGSLALVATPSLGVADFDDLVAMAKEKPGELNYSSPGSGTPHHLAMELVKRRLDLDLEHIPYKGSAGALTDLIGGQVNVGFMPIHQVLQQVRNGQLVMLTAGGLERTDVTPDVPSLGEASGLDDVDVDMWYGMYAPAGLSDAIVTRINDDLKTVLAMPQVIETLQKQGLTARTSTPAELATLTERDLDRWGQVVRDAGIHAE